MTLTFNQQPPTRALPRFRPWRGALPELPALPGEGRGAEAAAAVRLRCRFRDCPADLGYAYQLALRRTFCLYQAPRGFALRRDGQIVSARITHRAESQSRRGDPLIGRRGHGAEKDGIGELQSRDLPAEGIAIGSTDTVQLDCDRGPHFMAFGLADLLAAIDTER